MTDKREEKGIRRAPDGRIEPDDGTERETALPRDEDAEDDTPSGALVGGVAGAGAGAILGGPAGAVVGAGLGAAAGKIAEASNRGEENVPTGNPTDADSKRVRHDYFAGQVYEEGSLADVPNKRARDVHGRETPPTPKEPAE